MYILKKTTNTAKQSQKVKDLNDEIADIYSEERKHAEAQNVESAETKELRNIEWWRIWLEVIQDCTYFLQV